MNSCGQKLKMSKKCEKPFYKNITVVLCKNPSQKHKIFVKLGNIENRPFGKGYSLSKMVSWGQKLKVKITKSNSTRTLQLFCAKNRSKKHQIFEKLDNFENQPSCKGYSPCKN